MEVITMTEILDISYCSPHEMGDLELKTLKADIESSGKIMPDNVRKVLGSANDCYYCPYALMHGYGIYCSMPYSPLKKEGDFGQSNEVCSGD